MNPVTQLPTGGPRTPRALILAFDGTAGEFTGHNTNVVKLCAVMQMKDYEKQMVYYQPGVGTYTNPGILGSIQRWIAKTADLAVAWYLDAHIESGYEFLMQNHLPGDKIFIFGFSRGAYTARALAGMLHAVGLLPKGNQEQVPFAYSMYKGQDRTVADRFKGAFCKDVEIEMLGVWDTVASVGAIIPQTLPFTSNKAIKYFRHAVSLDERRVRFGVTLWQKEDEVTGRAIDPRAIHIGPQRVLEMFFAGCHADIGGGEEQDEAKTSLSNVPLRWMLHEIQTIYPDILFDQKTLDDLKIPVTCVVRDPFSDLAQTPAAPEGNGTAPDASIPPTEPTVDPVLELNPANSTPQPAQNGAAEPAVEPVVELPPADPSSQPPAPDIDPTIPNLVDSTVIKRPWSWRLPGAIWRPGDDFSATQEIPAWKQQDEADVQAPIHDKLKKSIFWWLIQWSWTGYRLKFDGRRVFPVEDPPGGKDSIHLIHPSVLTRKKTSGYIPYMVLPPDWEEFRVAAEVA